MTADIIISTFVVDGCKRPLGYLDHSESIIRGRELVVLIRRQARISLNGSEPAPIAGTVDRVVFEWIQVFSSRKNEEFYQARILTTAVNPEVLNRVPGFRWFAEVHGEKVKR